jgi:protein-L-isoaspartate(D-aspartate) O-methyltransferase
MSWPLRSVKRSIIPYALRKADRGHRAGNFFAASALNRRGRILARTRHEDRPMEDDIAKMRAWYARELQLTAPVRRNMAIIEAFATVPRELFLGPGPWRMIADPIPNESFTTPDDDRHWIYHDVLVAIDEARQLNNGLPSFWARNLDHLSLRPGERILQVGAGTGYYTAILAEIVGPKGRVTAVEHDGELAERARASLSSWSQVELIHGDGRTHDPGEVDAIVVFAGSTHPAALWLDRLAPGGRLLMPLTAESRWGFLLRVTRRRTEHPERIVLPTARRGEQFEADSIGFVGIFPCIGGRDEEAAWRLQAALDDLRRQAWPPRIPIAALHRGAPGPEAFGRVWYHGPGFWLEHKG